jgi:hypothetical protein
MRLLRRRSISVLRLVLYICERTVLTTCADTKSALIASLESLNRKIRISAVDCLAVLCRNAEAREIA